MADIFLDSWGSHSLFLEAMADNQILGTATGFVVDHTPPVLITNWHVLTGKDPDTGREITAGSPAPTHLRITHHSKTRLGNWRPFTEPLFELNGEARWLEHKAGRKIDVVALPIATPPEIQLFPLPLGAADVDIVAAPAMPATIIGFPLGMTSAGYFPVWKTGHIASEPSLDFGGQPSFLVDATTKSGMSGSPVILRISGGYRNSKGEYVFSGGGTKFLGVYSGRVDSSEARHRMDLGQVWKPQTIREILG